MKTKRSNPHKVAVEAARAIGRKWDWKNHLKCSWTYKWLTGFDVARAEHFAAKMRSAVGTDVQGVKIIARETHLTYRSVTMFAVFLNIKRTSPQATQLADTTRHIF
jgi:hypothetical protein